MSSQDNLTSIFGALADPTRRTILERLAGGDKNVTELAKPFKMTMPAVTKHLKVLEGAGLITRTRHAQLRPCRLEAARLKEASDWIAKYRKFWEGTFNRLDDYLKDLQVKEKKNARR